MKNRIINIILGITLVISVCGNIFLIKSLSDAKEQMTGFNSQIVTAEKQITDLQDQLSSQQTDFQNQLSELEQQLANKKEELTELEDTLSANQEYIESLEQPVQEEVKQDPVVEQPVQSANPPAGLGNMGTFQDLFGGDSSGIDTNFEPGSLGVGHLE